MIPDRFSRRSGTTTFKGNVISSRVGLAQFLLPFTIDHYRKAFDRCSVKYQTQIAKNQRKIF